MADTIVVLRDGRIEQVGTPMDLYHRPANAFVAGFIGSPRMNQLPTTVRHVSSDGVSVEMPGGLRLDLPVQPGDVQPGHTVTLGIRPEHLALEAHPSNATLNLDVYVTEPLGGETILYGHVDNAHTLVVKVPGGAKAQRGQPIPVSVKPEMCHLFREDGKAFERLPDVAESAGANFETIGARLS